MAPPNRCIGCRRQQLWLVTITDDTDRVVARGQVRLQNLEARP